MTLTKTPELSIIIPTFQRDELLKECIKSILSITNLEIQSIIGDDNIHSSTRDIIEIINDSRIEYWRPEKPTGGYPGIIRNKSVEIAKAPILYFLDDDDRTNPKELIKAVSLLRKSEKGVLIASPEPFGEEKKLVDGEKEYFENSGKFLKNTPSKYMATGRLLFGPTFIVSSTGLIKKSIFEKIGGFSAKRKLCEDVEMYANAIREEGYVYHPELAITQRRVSQNTLARVATKEETITTYEEIRQDYQARYGKMELYTIKMAHKIRTLIE